MRNPQPPDPIAEAPPNPAPDGLLPIHPPPIGDPPEKEQHVV